MLSPTPGGGWASFPLVHPGEWVVEWDVPDAAPRSEYAEAVDGSRTLASSGDGIAALLPCQDAPRTSIQTPMIDMLGIARTCRQLMLGFLQRVLPLSSVGAQVRPGGSGGFFAPRGLPGRFVALGITGTGPFGAGPALGAFGSELFPTQLRALGGSSVAVARVLGQALSLGLGGLLLHVFGNFPDTVAVLVLGPVAMIAIVASAVNPSCSPLRKGNAMRDAQPDLTAAHDQRAALAALADSRHTAVLVVDVQNLLVGFPLHPPVAEVPGSYTHLTLPTIHSV